MTEPIDHAAEALNYLGAAVIDTHGDDDRKVAIAAVHAKLASVAAQDRANELKRIEILAQFVTLGFAEAGEAIRDPYVRRNEHGDKLPNRIAPSVAASLGLGGESDGE